MRCYFEELKIDCTIDQLKPGLKSMPQYLFCYLKSALVENVPLGSSTTCVHFAYYTQGKQHTNMPNIKNGRNTV